MALPNTAQLTSQLASMPDSALKQMAMMHKNDPYTLPLIIAEDGRRKQLRQAAQMAAYQPQPKVVDQAAAAVGSLPEQQGIGMLPAQNIAQMADGGIAGYADGELVASNEPVVRMAGGGVARYQYGGRTVGPYSSTLPEYAIPGMIQPERMVPQQGSQEDETPILRRFFNYMGERADKARVAEAQMRIARGMGTPEDQQLVDTSYTNAQNYVVQRPTAGLPASFEKYRSKEASTAPAAEDKAAPKADAASAKTDYSLLNMGGPRTGGGVADLGKQYANILAGQKSEDPAAKERKALQEQMVSSAEQSKRDTEADQAKRGDVYKGREERLAKRERELAKADEMDSALALIAGGLKLAGTGGSFAKGISAAGEAYVAHRTEGLSKLRAAQERLGEARDRMEDLQINRDDMNAREIRQANNEINRAKMDAQKLGIDAIMARDNVNRDTAKSIFAATVQQNIAAMETSSRERIAAMPGANERIALLLGGGNLEKGLTRLTDIQAGKFNPTTAYTEYLSKRKEGDTVLSPQEFVTQIRSIQALMAGAPSASSKPTGKVYE